MDNETFENNTTVNEGETVIKSSTTSFVEDGAIVTTKAKTYSRDGSLTVQNQSLKDFFAKPSLLYHDEWTTVAGTNADLFSFNVGGALVGNANWMNKIQGFNLVRGTAVMRVMINANPFQAGRLLLRYIPCVSSMATGQIFSANASLITKSQHPHVELDCRDGIAELELPYITPSYFYDVKKASHDWGTFYITVLSPLVVGPAGETSVDITAYLYFKDFEMSAPLVPQSKKWSRKGKDVEAVYASERPISSSLTIVASAADSLSSVPVLSAAMDTVAWVARGASQLASFFGWSKPQNESNTTVMVSQYNRYAMTAEGADNALPTALSATNKLQTLSENSIYEGDEMSFNFIKSVVSYIDTYSWNTSQVTGTSIMSFGVSPAAFSRNGTRTAGPFTATYKTMPPFSFVAEGFRLWRGSIKIILKIVKTDFHTGRLQITFTPSSTTPYSVPTPTNSLLALREIVDIRGSSEICLQLPYLIPIDYLKSNEFMGNFDVVVINELRCPETAPSAINVLMFVCAGDDFELQAPSALPPVFVPQSKKWSETAGAVTAVCDVIGDEKPTPPSFDHSSLCIGEHFSSIKQLINRYSQFWCSISSPGNSPDVQIWPWAVGNTYLTAGGIITNGFVGDPMSYFSHMYVFRRGSVRVGILSSSATAFIKSVLSIMTTTSSYFGNTSKILGFLPFYTTSTGGPTNYATGSLHVRMSGNAGTLLNEGVYATEYFHVPYYCATRVSMAYVDASNNISSRNDQPFSGLMVSYPSNVAQMNLTRSGGDDFQFSYFLSAPPVYISAA